MSDPIELYAQLAPLHALDEHGICAEELEPFTTLDLILDREREKARSEFLIALSTSYGCWLGNWMVSTCGGEWVGRDCPTPPRIKLSGMIYSPIEAVRRRLISDTAPSIKVLLKQMMERDAERLAPPAPTLFQQAWDRRATDAKFVNLNVEDFDPEAALFALDPWVREILKPGSKVLCLAAGGGMHGPLHAAAGAEVTVVDFSDRLLEVDREIAKRFGLSLKTVCASMDAMDRITSESFDIVVQPVSHCYLHDIRSAYREVARVLKIGGVYVSQHKQPIALQLAWIEQQPRYVLNGPSVDGVLLPPNQPPGNALREQEMPEYVHSLETILGTLCESGFMIEGFREPLHADAWAPIGSAAHQALFAPPYLQVKARRRRQS